MTSVTRFLLQRTSEPRLQAPSPPLAVVDLAFQCAARAPDHALLRPWRYLVIEGDARYALGELFARTCPESASEQEVEKARRAPTRAPMIIVGIASPKSHPKVPEIEQVMSAGSGLSFLALALQDAGYGAMWRTGGVAYHPEVHQGLGLQPGESVVGFLYTGTVSVQKPSVPRPATSDFVEHWHGPGEHEGWQ